ncbi:MAG: sialidase family protein, partial [Terrimicrobiaceae bacterium]
MNLQIESRRTQPDYFAFVPSSTDRATAATGNEHFLVEQLASGRLFAVWTQSSFEGATDQHIVFSKSFDGGRTWLPPTGLVGSGIDDAMASWAFPLISRSGRIYVIYCRHTGVNDVFTHTTGLMACIFSDDEGTAWSNEVHLTMPRSIWDNPDPAMPPNWIVWQKPIRLADGRYFSGLTRWVSPSVLQPKNGDWWARPAVVEFLRFENIDEDPAPSDLKISFLSGNDRALRVGLRDEPEMPQMQEPSIVNLPDGRLFCVMRTTLGSPYYATSTDQGETWTDPLPLRQFDGGPVLPHPLSPCPIYSLGESGYVFLYHNHDGNFLNWTPVDTSHHRRPVCLARGEFRPGAEQPIWFSEPWFFMDNGG